MLPKLTAITISALSLPLLVSSHFTLQYPAARGFDDEKLVTFPCGGQDTVSKERTKWPLAGGPIQLNMEHDESVVQVLLAVGNDPGDAFNTILLPTIQQQGLGDFCLGDVVIPDTLGLKDGQNATLQVVTNGDPKGGLYNCADITLTTGTPSPATCKNGTNIKASEYKGDFVNANGTNPTSSSTDGTSTPSSSSASSTDAAATATSTSAAVAAMGRAEWGVWGVLAAVVCGALGVL